MANDTKFGFDPTAFLSKIKLGYGLATKLAYIAVCGIVASLVLAVVFIAAGQIALGAFFGVVAVASAVWCFERLMKFAKDNPVAALTEGVEFAGIVKMQWSKDPNMIDVTPEPTANTAPPKAITSGGDTNA